MTLFLGVRGAVNFLWESKLRMAWMILLATEERDRMRTARQLSVASIKRLSLLPFQYIS